jgi:hypothetical protein
MNTSDSIKAKADKLEKRYGKTTKTVTRSKPKFKAKLKPKLGKKKIGLTYEVKF